MPWIAMNNRRSSKSSLVSISLTSLTQPDDLGPGLAMATPDRRPGPPHSRQTVLRAKALAQGLKGVGSLENPPMQGYDPANNQAADAPEHFGGCVSQSLNCASHAIHSATCLARRSAIQASIRAYVVPVMRRNADHRPRSPSRNRGPRDTGIRRANSCGGLLGVGALLFLEDFRAKQAQVHDTGMRYPVFAPLRNRRGLYSAHFRNSSSAAKAGND